MYKARKTRRENSELTGKSIDNQMHHCTMLLKDESSEITPHPKKTMFFAEQFATVKGVHRIRSKAEFHSIKVNGQDFSMQNDTGSSVSLISTEIWRVSGSTTGALTLNGLKRKMDTKYTILVM